MGWKNVGMLLPSEIGSSWLAAAPVPYWLDHPGRPAPHAVPARALAHLGIRLTRWSLDRAGRHGGNGNAWLRTLDRFGLGCES